MAGSATRNPNNLRLYLLGGVLALWCCGICARLVYLQIFRYGSFEQRAVHQQSRTEEVSARRGIMAAHREPAYAGATPSLPVTERLTTRSLILPLFHDMTQAQQDHVVSALTSALTKPRSEISVPAR